MASSLDDLVYLEPGFDLSSLTMPQLRTILVKHDEPYPSSAKKAQLISILEEKVLPKAKKLLRDRDRVRRTSAGITDMSSQSNSEANEDEDEINERDSMPPPATPSTTTGSRRGRSRPSTRASTADTDDSALLQATPRRRGRPSRSTRASDAETTDDNLATPHISEATPKARSTARRTRKSEALPSYNETVERTPSVKTDSRAGSVFTDENPFQSGSSPTSHEPTPRARTVSGERKLKSTPRVSSDGHLLATYSGKRDSIRPIKIKQEEDDYVTPRKSTFEFPVSRLRTSTPKVEDESEPEVGEEFTPDEQLALETAYAESQAMASRQPSAVSWRLPTLVILFLLSLCGLYWRNEKFEIGFCGIGKPRWSLAETNVPGWAHVLEPQCEPCPPHAFCLENLKIECEKDFVESYHPLSLQGFLPIPPQCEVDNEKTDRIVAVANRAVQELRQQRAKYECGDGPEAKTPFIPEPELKKAVAEKRGPRVKMSDSEFDDLWASALGELVAREEVTTSGGTSSIAFASDSLANLPIICGFRRHLRLSLIAYRLPIFILVLSVCGLAYIRAEFLARRADIARVPELVGTTLDRLSTQAALHRRGEAPEPWIAIGQLRDDVLRSELRGNRREKLWKRVKAVVEGNANVRASVRESRSGDVARAWEWTGSTGNHLDSVRRESGRVRFSLSPGGEASPGIDEDMSIVRSARESRKWDEGRPIY